MKDNVEAIYPLSPMQQGLLFHTVYAPESGVYIGQMAVRLDGDLNIDALEQAWQRLIARHSSLRTAFVWKRIEEPRQVVHQRVSLNFDRLSWVGFSRSEQATKLQAYLYADRMRGFDLTKAPLMRAALIQLEDNAYYFVWTQHHVISDGWCLHLLVQEGFTFYQAICKGQHVTLEPTRPYRDYIAWLQKQNFAEAGAYWKRTLKGFTAPTPLFVDRHPGELSTKPDGRERRFQVPSETSMSLHRFARENQLTLNTLVQGVWAILLSRYSREQDVLFGMVVSGRPPDLAGSESMVGLFVNSLPLRVNVRPEDEVLGFLKALQDETAEMRQYEYSPLVDIHASSEVPRGLPLFESILAYQNYPPIESLDSYLTNLRVSEFQASDQTSFPLVIQAVGSGTSLSFRFCYDANRYDEDTIDRMIGHVHTLLQNIAAHCRRRIATLPMLTAEEQSALIHSKFNGDLRAQPVSAVYDRRSCLHERFVEQVDKTPDAVAVVCDDQQLTYAELNRQANQLAHYLLEKGVGPDVLVGLCLDRSIQMIVGLLGILKAGGAYVPLDPDYPQARLEFMLEDSRTPLLLTQQDLLPKLPEKKPAVLCIDADWDQIALRSDANPSAVALLDNTAYVIYTSGSTGRPKGTSISHANVGRLFDSTDAWFNFTSDDVWTVFHSIAFDFSVWEIWGALLYGGRLVVIPYWVSRSPETFYEVLRSQKVTVLNQTPSAFRQILQIEETLQVAPLALRAVVFGGEALDIKSLAPWFERHGDLQPKLVNMYGITETTVHVTYRGLSVADTVSIPKSVIGCPIPDLRIYLLDEQMQPVPVGIPGELHVGGAGLSRGYLGQPALTAERFVPDPFSKVGGARLYKSGDLARWLPDGDIEYLGRIDHQVKVRGFRIETAEIETILASHPAVRQAVVMLRGESQESASLVGYVVARDAQLEAPEQTGECSSERVTLWQNVFEETYRQGTHEDPTFNITGWNSSYTGQPIPSEEMRSWVDETVAQILELKPSRVLEIGCGTGLLLMRVAPQCAQYVATDFSQVSLDYVGQHAANLGLKDVTFLRRMADDFEGIAENSFDTVILNSVVQYFPSVEYFVRVLEGAVRATRAGGRIFIGDIRNLDLLEAFHAGVELEHANATLGQKEVSENVRRRIVQEEELAIEPALFRAIKQHLPKISHAEVRLKRGRHLNELTQFRYDVVLHIGGAAPRSSNIDSIDWQKGMTLPSLQETISRKGADAIIVRGVANSRLHSPVNAAEIVLRGEGVETAGAIRQRIRELPNNGIEPEDVFALGSTLGYSVSLTWTTDAKDGSYDVLLHRAEAAASFADSEEPLRAWNHYANNPLREMLSRRLVPELRRYLRSQVPEYMVPASFVVLESMPLTPHGKIDRAALPAPSGDRPKLDVPYVPATTDTEKELAKIWGDVLGVDRIGIHDNFFDLGGHSLMVIQLMSRVRKSFQVELPLREVFGAPTIKEIAEMIEAKILAKASSEKIDQLLAQLESMDEKKAVEMLGSSDPD